MILPDKLHELLRLSLDELRKCQVDCVINMNVWYRKGVIRCTVCLAGAVIKGCLSPTLSCATPADYDDDTFAKLCAIDNLRKGFVSNALRLLQRSVTYTLDRSISNYGEPGWWEEMEVLYGDLKDGSI